MNVIFMSAPMNHCILLTGIAGILLSLYGPARANETDDEINRLVVQAQNQAAAHAAGDVAKTIDQVAKLVPRASPEGVAAMTKLMENLDRMTLEAQEEPADARPPPKIMAAPPPVPQARPTPAPVSAELLDLLRRKGDAAFQIGNISEARRYYQRGAESGCAACAEALARTYDAKELRRVGAIGVGSDAALAETWRGRARQLGQSNSPQ